MKITLENPPAAIIAATLALSFIGGPTLASENEPAQDRSPTEQASDYIRDYLSDHRRAGSLAGSILGGALFAHPAGPVLGSLLGFLVGKQTMFNEDKVRSQQAKSLVARRSIAPPDGKGQGIPTLSFATSRGIKFDAPPPVNPARTVPPPSGMVSEPPPLPLAMIPMAAPDSFSREQITTMCGSGRALIDPRLRSLCFYYHGSWQDEPERDIARNAAPSAKTTGAVPPAPETAAALSPQAMNPVAAPTSSRMQIETVCGSGQAFADPRLRSLCFYFQGNWQDDQGQGSPSLSLANP